MTTKHGMLCSDCWLDVHFIDRPYCDISGMPFSYDLGDGIVSADVIANPPPYKRARAAVIYSGKARNIVHQFKFNDRGDLTTLMAGWMIRAGRECLEDADCIIPVPLHRKRLMSRKFNQSAELARQIAKECGIEYLPSTLIRKRHTQPQVGLAAKARLDNVKGAFEVMPDKVSTLIGKRVILIDDVLTTGATVEAASRTLSRAGASEISVLTFARVTHD